MRVTVGQLGWLEVVAADATPMPSPSAIIAARITFFIAGLHSLYPPMPADSLVVA